METTEGVQRRAGFSSKHFRPGVDKSVREHDPNLWNQARMFIQDITRRYVNYSRHSIGVLEVDLHDLWYLFIEAAKITPVDEAIADRLVNQVVYARELGQLARIVLPTDENSDATYDGEQQTVRIEHAITSTSARIWTDLPFLVTDLRVTWASSMKEVSSLQRANLAGFTARLAALGVCDPQLTLCALLLFREALETPRPLFGNEATESLECGNHVPLSDFLPAILAWFRYSGFKILSLCAKSQKDFEDDHVNDNEYWAGVGVLLPSSENQKLAGFNTTRWYFWKRRLQEIGQSTHHVVVAERARKCASIMDYWEDMIGGKTHNRNTARNAFFNAEI